MTRRRRDISLSVRREVKVHWDGLCAYCGFPGREVDHVYPFAWGGTDHITNLVWACGACNRMASDRCFDSFEDKRDWLVHFRRLEMEGVGPVGAPPDYAPLAPLAARRLDCVQCGSPLTGKQRTYCGWRCRGVVHRSRYYKPDAPRELA